MGRRWNTQMSEYRVKIERNKIKHNKIEQKQIRKRSMDCENTVPVSFFLIKFLKFQVILLEKFR